MNNIIEVPHKTQKPWATEDMPGWWYHAYGCIRVDCPKCGEFEGMAYWIMFDHVKDDGTVLGDPKTCKKCGLSGDLRLMGFNRSNWTTPIEQENK